jgi:hypothetical protein
VEEETRKIVQELVRQVTLLQRRVATLEAKEFAIIHTGAIDPVHSAPEATLYWDTLGDCLWVNSDGNVEWCLIACCQPS